MALTERDRQRAIRRKWQRTGRCWVCGKPRGMTNRRAAWGCPGSCGWSLLTDCAAQSEEHFRSQPQEQVTSQSGLSLLNSLRQTLRQRQQLRR
jgi:hypothetical protein